MSGRPEFPELSKVPRSVAIIMDGNGRWAQNQGRPRMMGHRAGAETVDRITEFASRLGVEHLTLYAFSTENWQRPTQEVTMLWRLLVRDLKRRGPKCIKNGIRLTSIGRRDRMPEKAVAELARVEQETAHCDRMTLCLALDYGGAWDLAEMARRANKMGAQGQGLDPDLEPQELLNQLLPSRQVPAVDLLIRTGGDSRISNFLPWQLSYAELMFVDRLWPDFSEQDFYNTLEAFSGKHRRFGRIQGSRTPEGVGG